MVEFVRTLRAHEGETVEIQWRRADGSLFIDRHTIPPRATREVRQSTEDRDQRERREALGVDNGRVQ